jgi:hypothetical protein
LAKEFLIEVSGQFPLRCGYYCEEEFFVKEFAEESRSLVKDFFLGFEDNKHCCPTFVAVIAKNFCEGFLGVEEMAQLCLSVVNRCSLHKSKECCVQVKAVRWEADLINRRSEPGERERRDFHVGFNRIHGRSSCRKLRKVLNPIKEFHRRSGCNGTGRSYDFHTRVIYRASIEVLDEEFERCHVRCSQPEGEGSTLSVSLTTCTTNEQDDGSEPERHAGQHEGSFHFGRRMLLGAVCTSLAFSSCSTADAEQEELKTATPSATSGTGGFAVGIDGKGRGSEVESGNGEKDTGSRVYDATVLGEPVPVGGEKGGVWQKLLAARVVYLGEAERVPDPDDKVHFLFTSHILSFTMHNVQCQRSKNYSEGSPDVVF